VGGVPNAQVCKNIDGPRARRLPPEQRRAVQCAFDDKAHLTGMGGLTGLDRLLDQGQHLARENPPYPPAVLNKMFGDALDTHDVSLPASRRAAAAKTAAAAGKAAVA
jgi:hypothetical protein